MWNHSRRQVNDSDPLETLADQRGTEMLPLTHSSSPRHVDIEEFNEEIRSEITSQIRGSGNGYVEETNKDNQSPHDYRKITDTATHEATKKK